MADVNALYPQPVPQNQGLLAGDPSKVLGIVGQLNQNALFQQQFRARKAIGDAYQEAIQPDGSIDTKALMGAIKKSPDAAFMAGEAAAGALDRQGKQISNTTAQFDQSAKQNAFVVDGLGALADKPNVSLNDVRNFVVTAARNTQIPSSMLNAWVSQLPRDPKALREALITMRNTATGSAGLSTPTQTGVVTEGPNAGAPFTGTRGQFNYGAGGVDGTQAPANAAITADPPGIQTALPPGVGEAKSTAGTASGGLLARERESGANYRREVMPLEQAIPKLEALGKTGTGPGTEDVNNIKSFLQSAGLPGLDAEKIKNFDEAKKYLTDWVMANGSAGTNDKLAASFASNASVGISNAAAVDVAKTALALRRMRQAQLQTFEQSGQPENKYAQWAAQWNAKTDPRVFGFDLMSPANRDRLLRSLPVGKRADFIMQVEEAERGGMLSPPQMKMGASSDKK